MKIFLSEALKMVPTKTLLVAAALLLLFLLGSNQYKVKLGVKEFQLEMESQKKH